MDFTLKRQRERPCPQSERLKKPENPNVVSETKPGGMKEKNYGGKTLVCALIFARLPLISLCRVESLKLQLLGKKGCSPH